MTQETQTVPGQQDPTEPTEAQIEGAAVKSFLLETLQDAFSALPEYLEDGTYVYNVGHSSPHKREGIVVAKEDIDNENTPYSSKTYQLTVLTREGIFKIRYFQETAYHPIVILGTREIPLEEYPNYKQTALDAIWSAPLTPKPPLNP